MCGLSRTLVWAFISTCRFCTAQVGVLIRNDTSLVSYAVVDVLLEDVQMSSMTVRNNHIIAHLKPSLAEKLIGRAGWYLHDGGEFVMCFLVLFSMSAMHSIDEMREIGKFFKMNCHLKVDYELVHNGLPGDETFDEDVRGAEVVGSDVLLDERLKSGKWLSSACWRGRWMWLWIARQCYHGGGGWTRERGATSPLRRDARAR